MSKKTQTFTAVSSPRFSRRSACSSGFSTRQLQARCAGAAIFTGWTRLPYDSSATILTARLPSMSTTEKAVNGLVWFGRPMTFHGACGAPPALPNDVNAD